MEFLAESLDDFSFLVWFFIVAKIFRWELVKLLRIRWYYFVTAYISVFILKLVVGVMVG